VKNSLRLLLGSLLIGASMLPARGMEAPAVPEAAGQAEPAAVEATAAASADPAPAPTADAGAGGEAAGAAHDPAPEASTELAGGRDTHWTETRTPMPFDVMRSVQFLQDQVARGNVRAIRVQALLLRRFARTFVEAAPEVWNDPRNTRAIVLFTFSGGTPDVIATLLDQGRLPEAERPLFDGALAYVRNDLKTAATKLEAISIDDLEPVLAAQVSLALGQIHQIDHPDKAIEDLANARLLAPGTLIEEAALRLGAPLADDAGAHDDADRMARRYFDTYHDSSYAANFETRYVALVVGRAMTDPQAALVAMDGVVAGLPTARQQRLYLAAARRSLVAGNLHFASQSADQAITLDGLEPGDAARANLYRTASALGADDQTASRKALDGIDRSLLHVEDQKILDAAYSVLDSMAKPALMTEVSNPAPPEPDTSSVLTRARAALDAASKEMKKP
jgi:chemotaxis protein MotC